MLKQRREIKLLHGCKSEPQRIVKIFIKSCKMLNSYDFWQLNTDNMCVELWTTRIFFSYFKTTYQFFFSRIAEKLSGVWMVAVWLHIKIKSLLMLERYANSWNRFLFFVRKCGCCSYAIIGNRFMTREYFIVLYSYVGVYNLKALKCDQSLFLLLYALFTRTNIRMHFVVSLCMSAVISMEIHFWFSNSNL